MTEKHLSINVIVRLKLNWKVAIAAFRQKKHLWNATRKCVFYLYMEYSPINGVSLEQSHRAPAESSACHPAAEHPLHLHGRSHQLIQLPAADFIQVSDTSTWSDLT